MREAPARDPLSIDVRWNRGGLVVLFVMVLCVGVFLVYALESKYGPTQIILGICVVLVVGVVSGEILNSYFKARTMGKFLKAKEIFELGRRFQLGRGVIKDEVEARRLYKLALNRLQDLGLQSDADTCYACAMLMEQIAGPDNLALCDSSVTSSYYLRAALMGNAKAQHEVARRYLLAQGLSQSLTEAYAWYNVSSATFEKELTDLYGGTRFVTDPRIQEAEKSANGREELARAMTPDGVAEGQRRSRELLRQIAELARKFELKF